jgi:hypothetical protein
LERCEERILQSITAGPLGIGTTQPQETVIGDNYTSL